ncbi:MAG: DEAD/DEAH box helicase, partial [Rubellimicrobium sp.]|nr:DEAD/DEAH box helicase [Rubellimicrobium sp.]
LLLTGVQIMVVDEADRMLDMGFIPDIERIFNLTPFTRQTLFFSATMAPEIERITNAFLHTPARVEVARAATTAESIEQGVVMFRGSSREVEASEKRAVLRALIDGEGEACTNAIVFCNRKTDVDIVAKSLRKYGYNAEPIHGDLDQSQRMRTLDGFRDGKVRLLVASDVAARGLDIPTVSHVFQFDVPTHSEDYVHRIGRTGRAGRSGKALMICNARDEKLLDAIEKLVQKEIPRVENPLKDAPPREPRPARARRDEGGKGRSRRPADKAEVAAPPAAEDTTPAPRPRRERTERPERAERAAVEPVTPRAEARAETRPEPRPETRAEPRPERERDRDRDGRRGGRREGRDEVVVGMGDDAPAFIRMSFDERRAG